MYCSVAGSQDDTYMAVRTRSVESGTAREKDRDQAKREAVEHPAHSSFTNYDPPGFTFFLPHSFLGRNITSKKRCKQMMELTRLAC